MSEARVAPKPDQDVLFLSIEDQFYKKFDKDIVVSTLTISNVIESYSD
jgi:hypothetical protein